MYFLHRLSQGTQNYFAVFRLFSVNVRAVMAYAVFEGLVYGVFRLLFNFYVLSLGHYDNSFLGNLTSVSSLASMIVAVPAAWVAGRIPPKWIMIVTGILSGASLLGMIAFPFRETLIAFNVLSGMAVSFRQVAVAPFLMSNTGDKERQYVFSFNFGLGLVADFSGTVLGGFLPLWLGSLIHAPETSTAAYQAALTAIGLVALLSTIPLLAIRRGAGGGPEITPLDLRKLPRYARQVGKILASPLAIGLGAGLFIPFMNIYFREIFGQSDGAVGLIVGIGSLGMAVAQFLAPPLALRIGKIRTVSLTQSLSIPFLILLGLAAYFVPAGMGGVSVWFAAAVVAFFFRVSLMNLSGPVYQTFILEYVDRDAMALTTSLYNMSFTVGWFISPSIGGWFLDQWKPYGFVPIFASVSILYVIGTATLWLFFRNAERDIAEARVTEPRLVGAK